MTERADKKLPGERLFAYGTLLFADVTELVIGRRPRGRDATLSGYARYQVRGECFPAVVADAAGETHGLLFDDISAAELGRLDAYEGELYLRASLPVQLAASAARATNEPASLDALVYVFRPELAHALSDLPWDPQRFAKEQLPAYLDSLRRARA